MKNIKNILVLLIISSLVLTSCQDFVEGINEDPNTPLDASAEVSFQGALISNQFWQTAESVRLSMLWLGQGTGADRQYIPLNDWNNATAGDFNNAWQEAYVGTVVQSQIGAKKAQEKNNLVLQGAYQVLEAQTMGMVTALWGDVPYTEVNKPDIKNPKYDSQASVYAAVQDLLTKAIQNLGTGTGSIPRDKDVVYSGDASKWIAAAHTLKARFYLHEGKYGLALAETANGINSAAGDYKAKFGTSYGGSFNPFYSFLVYDRSGYMSGNGYCVEILNPNSSKYRGNSKTDESSRLYFNYYNQYQVYNSGWELNYTSLYDSWGFPADGKFGTESDLSLISYGENLLIKAECEARENGLSAGVTAYNAYRNELNAGYSIGTNNGGSFWGNTLKYDAYADLDFAAGGIENADNISDIDAFYRELFEERYVYFNGHFEAFISFARSNNKAEIELRSGQTGMPQRFLYPQVEINSNSSVPSPIPSVTDKTPINQ